MSTVRQHTRVRNGRTETVHRHERDSNGMSERDLNRRDAFERRVLRERQAARRGQPLATGRAAGERKPKRKATPARARRYARKAWRSRRRHAGTSVFYALLALGTITAWGGAGAGRAMKSGWMMFWSVMP